MPTRHTANSRAFRCARSSSVRIIAGIAPAGAGRGRSAANLAARPPLLFSPLFSPVVKRRGRRAVLSDCRGSAVTIRLASRHAVTPAVTAMSTARPVETLLVTAVTGPLEPVTAVTTGFRAVLWAIGGRTVTACRAAEVLRAGRRRVRRLCPRPCRARSRAGSAGRAQAL